jgi:hypothetical protein
MPRKLKLLILIFAIVLIPILLWMTPWGLVHKLSGGSPVSEGQQIKRDFCLFNSLIPHHDLAIGILNSTLVGEDLTPSLHSQTMIPDRSESDISLRPVCLRC